jgi:hypothetical protein
MWAAPDASLPGGRGRGCAGRHYRGPTNGARRATARRRWGIDEYAVASQRLTSHHFETVDGRVERFSVPCRYAWPSELDLMAELAGMRLRERSAGWQREPFGDESRQHVSVWEKPKS